jgi:hypothetical protein
MPPVKVRCEYLPQLCVRGADHGELGGSNGQDHSAQEAAAIMVDFFGRLSLPLQIDLECRLVSSIDEGQQIFVHLVLKRRA